MPVAIIFLTKGISLISELFKSFLKYTFASKTISLSIPKSALLKSSGLCP